MFFLHHWDLNPWEEFNKCLLNNRMTGWMKCSFLDFRCSALWAWTLNKCLVDDKLWHCNPLCIQNSEPAIACFGILSPLRWMRGGTQNTPSSYWQQGCRYLWSEKQWHSVASVGQWKAWLPVFPLLLLVQGLGFTMKNSVEKPVARTVTFSKSCSNLLGFCLIMTLFMWWQRSPLR